MGTNSALVAPVDLHEGVPDTGIRSRELKVFGAIEVAHHRLLPGEVEALPLQVAPGQPAPERLVPPNTATQRTHAREARGHGRRRYGGSPRFAPSLGRWHHTYGGKGLICRLWAARRGAGTSTSASFTTSLTQNLSRRQRKKP